MPRSPKLPKEELVKNSEESKKFLKNTYADCVRRGGKIRTMRYRDGTTVRYCTINGGTYYDEPRKPARRLKKGQYPGPLTDEEEE